MFDEIKRLAGATDPTPKAVIVDMGSNSNLDITTGEKLGELITTLRSADIDVALAEVRGPVVDAARRAGILATLRDDHVFPTIDAAVKALAGLDESVTAAR